MPDKIIPLERNKSIALIAHDNKKQDLIDWVEKHREELGHHQLYGTGTTGELIRRTCGVNITTYRSGPLGGDQQVGAAIAAGEIDFLIFFWDPLTPMSHDPDVKALLRMAVIWNIPMACNRATADFPLTSPLMTEEYPRAVMDYDAYRKARVEKGF